MSRKPISVVWNGSNYDSISDLAEQEKRSVSTIWKCLKYDTPLKTKRGEKEYIDYKLEFEDFIR